MPDLTVDIGFTAGRKGRELYMHLFEREDGKSVGHLCHYDSLEDLYKFFVEESRSVEARSISGVEPIAANEKIKHFTLIIK